MGWSVLSHLTEVSIEPSPTLANTVEADSAIHALARAIFDLTGHYFDVGANVLLSSQFTVELDLQNTAIASDVSWELNLFSFSRASLSTARESAFGSFRGRAV